METLKFIEQKTFHRRNKGRKRLFAAVLLAVGTFLCLKELLQIKVTFARQGISGIGSGLIHTWNQIVDTLGRNGYLILPKCEEMGGSNLFFLLCVFLVLLFFFFFLLRSGHAFGILAIAVGVAALGGMLGLQLSVRTSLLFGTAMAGGTLYVQKKGVGFWQNLILLAVIAVLTMGAFSVPAVQRIADGTGTVRAVRKTVQRQAEKSYYGENILKNGDLTGRTRETGVGEALQITMSRPQSLYLRGFVGERYMGDHWETLPHRTYYDTKNFFYWLERDKFQIFGQLGQAAKLTAETEEAKEQQIDIQIKDADRRYAYLTYEMQGNIGQGKTWGGTVVTPSKFRRLNAYSYQSGDNAVKHWTDTASKIFLLSESAAAYDKEKKQRALETYLSDESYYNAYVYENFTYLSKMERLFLQSYIGDSGNPPEQHADYKTIICGIQEYFEKQFIYTERLGAPSGKNDSVLEEFFRSKKGYDIHFASAAVCMFRYYGIPARYVEGYLITPEDAAQMESGKPKSVKRERAHAWVEIYIDGIGFVPIEVSPPYRAVMEEADMEVGVSDDAWTKPVVQEQPDARQKEEPKSDTDRETPPVFPIKRLLLLSLAILLFCLLLWIVLKMMHRLSVIWKRKRTFEKAEAKHAVSAIFAYMEEKRYPVEAEVRILGNKAAYSPFPITEEERAFMLRQLKMAGKERKKNEKRKKKRA